MFPDPIPAPPVVEKDHLMRYEKEICDLKMVQRSKNATSVDQVLGYDHVAFLSHPNPTSEVEKDQVLGYGHRYQTRIRD